MYQKMAQGEVIFSGGGRVPPVQRYRGDAERRGLPKPPAPHLRGARPMRFALSLLMLVAVCASADTHAPPDLLVNGGFEQGGGG